MGDDDGAELGVPGIHALQRSVFDWIKDEENTEVVKLHQTITAEEVAQYGIPQKVFMRYLKSEIDEASACFSLPFTLLLVFSFAIMAVAHDDAITIRAVQGSLETDIRQNANFGYTSHYIGHKNIDDISSFADLWSWLRLGLLPLLFKQNSEYHEGWEESEYATIFANLSAYTISPDERGFWLRFNRIIGGIRLSQERSPEEVDCPTESSVLPLYNSKCVGGLDYLLEPEIGLPAEPAQNTIEPQRIEWIWASTDLAHMNHDMLNLEASGWLDRLTQKVEIAIPTYNAEFGLHTLTRVNFYFSQGGYIWKRILPMSQYSDWHDRWYYLFYDIIWCSSVVYMLGIELMQIQVVVRTRGCQAVLTDYFNVWNFIDWMSILGAIAIVAVFIISIGMRTQMNGTLERLGDSSNAVTGDFYRGIAKEYLEQLQDNVNYVRHLRLCVAVYPLIIVLRLFKSFSAQPKLALVTRTLGSAAPDLFHFAIVFGAAFVTFVVCGCVLFGRETPSFTTFNRAIVSCFRIMLGDIDWEELSEIGRTEAAIWLWLAVLIIVLVMLNMIVAIILDHYEDVRITSGAAESLWEEGYQMWYRWRGKRNGIYVPLNRVLDALHDQARRDKLNKHFAQRGSTDGGNLPVQINVGSDAEPKTGTGAKDPDLLTIEKLCNIVNRASAIKMHENQALETLVAAAMDYYEENKKGAELDEVIQLTQKVNFLTKKLVRSARKAHEERDTTPVEELELFGTKVKEYLDRVKQERKDNVAKLKALRKKRKELETSLESLGGGFTKAETVSWNKRASIQRTISRLSNRPPSLE